MTRRDFVHTAAVAAFAQPAFAAAPRFRMGICTTSGMAERPAGGGGRRPDTLSYLEKCAALGAGGIQSAVSGDPAKLRARADELGMYLEGIVAIPRTGDMSALEKQLQDCRGAGITVVRTGMLNGRRYETFPTLAEWNAWVKQSQAALKLAVPLAERYKITLAMENHKDWTTEQYLDIFRSYQSEYLGANYDFGNNISFLEDPMEMAEAVAPYVKAAHIKDIGLQPYADGFMMAEVPLGQGYLDLPGMCATLVKANPKLKFSLEMMTRNPLKVPCLTDHYWEVFPDRGGRYLARTLKTVEKYKSAKPLPVVEGLAAADLLKLEVENVKLCLEYGKAKLNL